MDYIENCNYLYHDEIGAPYYDRNQVSIQPGHSLQRQRSDHEAFKCYERDWLEERDGCKKKLFSFKPYNLSYHTCCPNVG